MLAIEACLYSSSQPYPQRGEGTNEARRPSTVHLCFNHREDPNELNYLRETLLGRSEIKVIPFFSIGLDRLKTQLIQLVLQDLQDLVPGQGTDEELFSVGEDPEGFSQTQGVLA